MTDITEDLLRRAALVMHERGEEVTSEQVGDRSASSIAFLRELLDGHDLPESDIDFLCYLKLYGILDKIKEINERG